MSQFNSRWGGQIPGGALTDFIPGARSRSRTATTGTPIGELHLPRLVVGRRSNDQAHNVWRASAAYVTGSHSLKVGYQAAFQVQKQLPERRQPDLSYVFNNRQPDSVHAARCAVLRRAIARASTPSTCRTSGRAAGSRCRAALRYEHAWSWFPEGENGVVEDNAFMAPDSCSPRRTA